MPAPSPEAAEARVHFGGPVEHGRGFVLHTGEYAVEGASLRVNDAFVMTATVDILQDMARGEGPAQAIDFQEPYLRQLLGFIGITDVTFVRAEKVGYGPEARQAAIAGAEAELAALTGAPLHADGAVTDLIVPEV